jgi:hypothetical protein
MRWFLAPLIALTSVTACATHEGSDGDGDGKSDQSFGDPIVIGDKETPRIAFPPLLPLNQLQLDTIVGGFLAGAVANMRGDIAAELALDHTVVGDDGKPVRFGRVAYVRPGLGNISPSPAQVFLLARHFDVVVLMYTNMTDPFSDKAFGRSKSIGGVQIPEPIRDQVKIFEIGSPQFNLISASQQSDVTLEQLELMHQERDQLGFDPLTEPAWIFAHSQGSNDAVISDQRLRDLGFAGFDHIITMGGALEGGRLINTATGLTWRAGATAAAGLQGDAAIFGLAPQITRQVFAANLGVDPDDVASELGKRIDFAFGGEINLFFPFGNIRPGLLALASHPDEFGFVLPSDGMVNTRAARLDIPGGVFSQCDHVLIFEDPGLLGMVLKEIRDRGGIN